MRRKKPNDDYAGLIVVKIEGARDRAEAYRIVSAALEPYATEPLDWESDKPLARLRLEGEDPTVSRRVLAIEQTLGAAVAIREAFAGVDATVGLACDVEPTNAEPRESEYWVRRQRLESLVETSQNETLCRRVMVAARGRTLDQLGVHFDPSARAGALRLVPGPATALVGDVGRSVVDYIDLRPRYQENALGARDIASEASPTPATKIVLVVAEAWVGKTYVARKLEKALGDRKIEVSFTSFEDDAPYWPDDEFLANTNPRVWIVDAVDEAGQREPTAKLKRAVRATALTMLVFTRPDSTLDSVERALGFSPEPAPTDGISRSKLRLLPLDDEQIRRELADLGEARLTRLFEVAKGFSVRLTYAELRELAKSIDAAQPEQTPNLSTLREAVARRRCNAPRAGRGPLAIKEEKMLEAAQFLAAVAALANEPIFHYGAPLATGFAVNAVLPEELLTGVHALTETTALDRIGDAYRFAAAHLEEDLAAGFLARAVKKRTPPVSVPALRSLLTDGSQPRPELERVIQRAREVLGPDDRVLREALKPFEPGDAVRRFHEIVGAAGESREPVWGPTNERLTWLNTPIVQRETGALLADESQPSTVRHLLLRLAVANDWKELAPVAAEIALSPPELPRIRQVALELAARDSNQLDRLRGLFREVPRDQPDEKLAQLRAALVIDLLQARRLSPLEAARELPRSSAHVYDLRSHAIVDVIASLDPQAARAILDELDESRSGATARTIDRNVLDELRDVAVGVFLASGLDTAGEDVARLVYVVKSTDRFPSTYLTERRELHNLGDDVRRAVYQRLDVAGEVSGLFLPEKDADWLIAYAGSQGELKKNVHNDLFASIQTLEQQGHSSTAERGREILRREGVWKTFEAKHASALEWQTRQEEWAQARARGIEETRKTALPLERVVDTFLGDRRDASVRLHALGDFFFGERLSGTNVVGTFEDDLTKSQRTAIMDATWDALERATPTPVQISDGNTFSSVILDEGHAFSAAASWKPDRLDASLIARWLPAALFAATMDSEIRVEDLIDRSLAAAPVETRRVMVDAIAREARRGNAWTHRIPAVLWKDARFFRELLSLVRTLAGGDEKQRQALVGLLFDALDACDSASAPPEVRALLEDLAQSSDTWVSRRAIGAWFYRWPDESVDRAVDATTSIEDAVAVFAPYFSLEARYYLRASSTRSRQRALSGSVTARLVCHLVLLVPETRPIVGGFVGSIPDVDELPRWRDQLVHRCIEGRDDPAFAEAIDEIGQHAPYAEWLRAARDSRRVEDLLEAPPREWPTPVQVADIIQGTLALIHDVADLALLVAEIANRPWDQSLSKLLYEQCDRNESPKHGREDKLQILLWDKLQEGLGNVRPPVQATVVREPNERAADEPDFVVFTTNHVPRLEVPVEVKWSDDSAKVIAGLSNQLGERYLGQSGRTHGVFVVGWTGEPSDRSQLETKLEEAKNLQEEKGRTIHIVWKDVRHPRWR